MAREPDRRRSLGATAARRPPSARWSKSHLAGRPSPSGGPSCCEPPAPFPVRRRSVGPLPHGRGSDLGEGGPLPHFTTGQALAGVDAPAESGEVVRGRWGHLLPEIPPGENYLHYTAERGHTDPIFEWRSRYWSFLLKLDPNRPSPTIQAQPGPNVGPFHWENRRLRVPELRRLFTFPDDYAFVGRRGSVQSQIGNSVPPLLAEHVGRSVAAGS